jgi:hypothetical protein
LVVVVRHQILEAALPHREQQTRAVVVVVHIAELLELAALALLLFATLALLNGLQAAQLLLQVIGSVIHLHLLEHWLLRLLRS